MHQLVNKQNFDNIKMHGTNVKKYIFSSFNILYYVSPGFVLSNLNLRLLSTFCIRGCTLVSSCTLGPHSKHCEKCFISQVFP